MRRPSETLYHWADLGDNRIGPLLRELVEAACCEDRQRIEIIAARLRYIASSLQSYADQLSTNPQ